MYPSAGQATRIRSARFLASAFCLILGQVCVAGEAIELHIVCRDSFLPGVPVLVRAELRHLDGSLASEYWDEIVDLETDPGGRLDSDQVKLWSGVGSALVTIDGEEDVTLTARARGVEFTKTLRSLSGDPQVEVSGDLPSGLSEWSGIVRVTDDTRVPEDGTLRIAAGTLILLDGVEDGSDGADLNVVGHLESMGTRSQPVTFTAVDPELPWGEIHHDEAQPSEYHYTHVTRAGNSPGGGHTGTGPSIRPDDSEIQLDWCAFSDHVGKVMEADGSDLQMRHCLLSRSVMGPEIDNTALVFEDCYITEMYGDDDNDGIYMHSQGSDQELVIRRCIVAGGDDDGIDTLGADVTIEDTIVRDFADKGISVFHDDIFIRGCLVVDNDIGISAKSSDDDHAYVTVERTTIVNNMIGIQARDKSGEPDADIQ
ncbi:MAG: right-handed parallel beta-helix repeat-containing protein, partial [Planctomycetota bacterium]